MRPEEYSVQYKCPPGCVKFFHAVLHDEGQVNFNKMVVCTYERPLPDSRTTYFHFLDKGSKFTHEEIVENGHATNTCCRSLALRHVHRGGSSE